MTPLWVISIKNLWSFYIFFNRVMTFKARWPPRSWFRHDQNECYVVVAVPIQGHIITYYIYYMALFLSPHWYAQLWRQTVEFWQLSGLRHKSWKMASEVNQIKVCKFQNINIPVCVFECFYWKIWNSIPSSIFVKFKIRHLCKKCIKNFVLLLGS